MKRGSLREIDADSSTTKQQVFLGFTDIVATCTGYITAVLVAPKTTYVGADAVTIGNFFRMFVKIHQELLNGWIDQDGANDFHDYTLAFSILGTVEASVAVTMGADTASLNIAIDSAIKVYS
ncbi:hypothetical protein VTI74DRAFT_10595 [Chaetomium olivicolor]